MRDSNVNAASVVVEYSNNSSGPPPNDSERFSIPMTTLGVFSRSIVLTVGGPVVQNNGIAETRFPPPVRTHTFRYTEAVSRFGAGGAAKSVTVTLP